MKNDDSLILKPRPELETRLKYQPGFSIEQIKRQYGVGEVIKLASNENPLGPSPKGLDAYKDVARKIFRYPESFSFDLRNVIAKKFLVGLEGVIVGAGSDEIIEMLAKAFLTPEDEVVVSEYSFLQYRIAAELMGAKVVAVPMRNMRYDVDAMAKAVTEKTKLVFIANPNNPTGCYVSKLELAEFLVKLPNHVFPVIDEAYFEYASEEKDYPSSFHEFFHKRSMMVLRTFSKIYGLAGLRVGYGIGPEEIISVLDKVRPPFNVSLPAQSAAIAAFGDTAFVEESLELNRKERNFLREELVKMGFNVLPSATNFLLFETQPKRGRILFERLLHKGVIIRSVDEYGLNEYLRVTVGKPQENRIFLKALKEVLEEK